MCALFAGMCVCVYVFADKGLYVCACVQLGLVWSGFLCVYVFVICLGLVWSGCVCA